MRLQICFFLKNLFKIQELHELWTLYPFLHLFSKNIFKYFYKNDFFLKTNYTSNLQRSFIVANLRLFNNFLNKVNFGQTKVAIENHLMFNHYFLPIRIWNFTINKKFYENLLFVIFFMNLNAWYSFPSQFRIFLNFLIIDFKWQQSIFYNGFFCNVYNF